MAAHGTPHDSVFRAILDTQGQAVAVLRAHLPSALAAHVSHKSLEQVEGTFIDEDLRNSQSDRLYRIRLPDGSVVFVYVLLEHKSTPDPRTPLQLLRYMLRIWERYGPEDGPRWPAIVPLVFYHGPTPWTVPTSMVAALQADPTLRAELRDLRYILRDLGRIEDRDLAEDAEARSGLMALKYAYRPDGLDHLTDILRGLRSESLLEARVVRYIANVFQALSVADLREAARRAKPEREQAMVSLAAQEWMQEGRAQGLQEGRQEGLQEGRQEGLEEGLRRGRLEGVKDGKVTAVLMMLRTRLGDIDPERVARIQALSMAQLDRLLQRAVTANTLDEVFDGLE